MDSTTTARFLALRLARAETAEPVVSVGRGRAREPSDEALLLRVTGGDSEALGLLFERYALLVRGIGRKILRDDAEADDLVQDVFLFLQRKCAIFDGAKSAAGSWIVQMTYQRAIEKRRYLATRHFYKREDLQGAAVRMASMATSESDYSAEAVFGKNGLEKVLGALSDDQRETLRLHFFEGYTLAEVSEKLGQPLGNVRHHYYRGLDKLRKQMFRP